MGCNCGGASQPGSNFQSAPRNAPVKTFEGPNARQQAELYAARNGGGHIRAVEPTASTSTPD